MPVQLQIWRCYTSMRLRRHVVIRVPQQHVSGMYRCRYKGVTPACEWHVCLPLQRYCTNILVTYIPAVTMVLHQNVSDMYTCRYSGAITACEWHVHSRYKGVTPARECHVHMPSQGCYASM